MVGRTQAVNTLERVSTDDDVGDGSTILKDEDSVIAASVVIGVARLTTIKLLVAEVLIAGDGARSRKRSDTADASGDVESLCRRNADNKGDELNLGELHLETC